MSEKLKGFSSVKTKISAFVAALLSGLIFLYSGIVDNPVFGQSILEKVQLYFGNVSPAVQGGLAAALNVLLLIANFTGFVVFAAAILILVNKTKAAKITLMIAIGTGLFAFITPIIPAFFVGSDAIRMALEGIATKYALAVLFGLISRLYLKGL